MPLHHPCCALCVHSLAGTHTHAHARTCSLIAPRPHRPSQSRFSTLHERWCGNECVHAPCDPTCATCGSFFCHARDERHAMFNHCCTQQQAILRTKLQASSDERAQLVRFDLDMRTVEMLLVIRDAVSLPCLRTVHDPCHARTVCNDNADSNAQTAACRTR